MKTLKEDWSFNPYFIGLPILILVLYQQKCLSESVSILILLDYLFLLGGKIMKKYGERLFQSLFYWITYSYNVVEIEEGEEIVMVSILILLDYLFLLLNKKIAKNIEGCFNPYFIGLPILIFFITPVALGLETFQSLFYWITYSYFCKE